MEKGETLWEIMSMASTLATLQELTIVFVTLYAPLHVPHVMNDEQRLAQRVQAATDSGGPQLPLIR